MPIQIELRFKLRHSTKVHVRQLSPEEYFDPLGPDETYATHGDPKYPYNHNYLEYDVKQLEWTECIRRGAMGDATLRMEYLQDGWFSHTASTPDEPELLILNARLPDGSEHAVRMRRSTRSDPWMVEFNYLYVKRDDGSATILNLETRTDSGSYDSFPA